MIFRLAKASDDAQLRKLMRETVLPGHIRMIYAREPDFFAGVRCMGDDTQVIVADDAGKIAGVGCRSARSLYVNGQARNVGYLSGLRLSPWIRNGTVLARGYSFLKELHGDKRTPAYLTTIIHGNERARQMLTSGRAGLPSYRAKGTYVTHVFPVRKRPAREAAYGALKMRRGADVPPKQLSAFLAKGGARRQFFPVCGSNGDSGDMLNALGVRNLLVVQRQGEIVGTMAIWDQSEYKQHVVAGYSRRFRTLLPIVNLGLRLKGCHRLPPSGKQLRYATAALISIQDDDSDVFRALLQCILERASSTGLHQLALGLHERDPLRSALKAYSHVTYRSWLYLVCWEDEAWCSSLDDSLVPYLELGML